jgi:hypothetical protein
MGEYTEVLHEARRKEQGEKAAKRKAGSEFMPQPPLSLPPPPVRNELGVPSTSRLSGSTSEREGKRIGSLGRSEAWRGVGLLTMS